jgi:hypothetical protein
LIRDLGLKDKTRLDLWKNGEWITINIESVIIIDKDDRVLLKMHPNAKTSLKNSECPGLEEKIRQQKTAFRPGAKRPARDFISPIRNTKAPKIKCSSTIHSFEANQSPILLEPTSRESSATPPLRITQDPQPQNLAKNPRKPSNKPAQTIDQPIPEAKVKMWPYDFHVYEINDGFSQFEAIMKAHIVPRADGRSHHSKNANSVDSEIEKYSITVEDAFERAFPNTAYKKATFYDHKKLWKNGDKGLQNRFIALGNSPQATYKCYRNAIKNPIHIPPLPTFNDDLPNAIPDSVRNDSQDSQPAPTEIPPTQEIFQDETVNELMNRVQRMKEALDGILLLPKVSIFYRASRNSFSASTATTTPNTTLQQCMA